MDKEFAFAIAVSVLMAATVEANARIVCKDGYQRVKGQEIATPYCQDEYMAAVAREHGVKVAGAEIRRNPSLKYELCRFIGADIRIQGNCPPQSDSGDSH